LVDTVPAALRAASRRFGDAAALLSPDGESTSFTTLDRVADAFARALIADGMAPGERIGIWSANCWQWVAAAVGVERAGGVLVPLNARLRGAEVADILRRARVTRLVSAGEVHGRSYPAMLRGEDLPELQRVIVLRGDPSRVAGREIAWDAFLSLGGPANEAALREREAGVTGDTLSDIMFTSGTTGRPKGALFTHRATVRAAENMGRFAGVKTGDRYCPMGPFAHLGGYKTGFVLGLLRGATICWGDAYDSKSTLDLIARNRINVMPAPPVIWQDVLDNPNRQDWDLSSLRFCATGGTMVPPEVVRRLVAELHVDQVGNGYGMTETSGMTAFTRPEDTVEQVAYTVGRAADAEIRIVGSDGRILGPGETGEVVVRNDRVLVAYLDDPAATSATLDGDGWLRTGDVGSVDAEGYLRITDRLKDMYISNGFNVYPAEIEHMLSGLPGMQECAVVGVPDARRGEVGHVFIVPAPHGTLTQAEVLAWCKQSFANYKQPGGVTFVDELPRNSLGKVLKTQLREMVVAPA
jgi:acyl-CoA synthetase (AMP-forming)/AMP-acid ligase II